MKKAKKICTYPGCNALTDNGSRCPEHPYKTIRQRLDRTKTDEDRRFYSSRKWTQTSLKHREIEPLCRRCRADGYVVQGTLVHHNPDRKELIAKGLSPFDHEYLETLCFSCHQKELRAKQN